MTVRRSLVPPGIRRRPTTEGSTETRTGSPANSCQPLAWPPAGHGKGDQEKHDSDATDDVRYHGDRAGDIARVGPDEADDDPRDEQSDHRGEPVLDPSNCDALERSPGTCEGARFPALKFPLWGQAR